MTNITWSDKSDGAGTTAETRVSAADMNAIKTAVNSKEDLSAFSTNTNASVPLTLAHDRARVRFTHATPVLVIQTQASVAYPDGFVMWGRAPSGMVVDAPAGVTLNSTDGKNEAIGPSTLGHEFKLSRDASNAWTVTFSLAPSAFARTLLDDPDAATTRTSLELGTAALLDVEVPEEATCYHILTRTAFAMVGDGIAADHLVSGSQILTPVAGAITHLYPLDPATSTELPEEAEARANRPLNALVSVTAANSASDAQALIYPDPIDGAVLTGMENRVIQTAIINADPTATITVSVAPYVAGRRRARWRGALTDVALAPADELLARAHWFRGELDVDQFIRPAIWADIEYVAGSGVVTAGATANVANVLVGDLIVVQQTRIGGTSITLPTGKGYAFPTAAPYSSIGQLYQAATSRVTRVAWTWATADGTFSTGTFTGSTGRTMAAAYRNVAGVRQINAASGETSTSLAWPALPGALVPNAWVVGLVNASNLAAAPSPTGSTVDASYAAGDASATALTIWHYADVASHAPAQTTIASANWAATCLELIPRRID